ncbi:MAG: type II toxin-antitoxin system HicB family antitoxin [Chloroflexi bacterium]|nr:type II toxin-antitoxin system HicB family antitoxin [Chloroflexota bacterium]
MTNRFFTVLLQPDDEGEGYTVTVPALPGCVSEGDTLDEALSNARDAIGAVLDDMQRCGEPIPDGPLPAHVLTTAIARAEEISRIAFEDAREAGTATVTEPPGVTVATVEITPAVAVS